MELDLPRGAVGRIAIIVDRYPCLSESFVRRELAYLESCGFALAVVTCSPAHQCDTWLSHELHATIFRPEECARGDGWWRYMHLGVEMLRGLRHARTFFPPGPRGLAAASHVAWTAAAIRPRLEGWRPDWVHAHFLGMPAATACLLTDRLGVPLSISAHARDVFVPAVRLASVCARAKFVAACSEHAQASLVERLPVALAKSIVHFSHNVDCEPAIMAREMRDGAPLRLLSVCRLVPKKGIDVVLQALVLLRLEMSYHYRIVGDGPELPLLKMLARKLGLESVEFVGPIPPGLVPAELAWADIFVLGTRTAPDGDRDGIPNAILEAMAAGVPVVASDGGAVSEVIKHRRTGWLPPPNNPRALAEALREAASDYALRQEVAVNAHAEVWQRFSYERSPNLLALRLASEIEALKAHDQTT